jgi:hypothetical protein
LPFDDDLTNILCETTAISLTALACCSRSKASQKLVLLFTKQTARLVSFSSVLRFNVKDKDMMPLMLRPVGLSAFVGRSGDDNQAALGGAFRISLSGEPKDSETDARRTSPEGNSTGYRMCLDCALPLKTSGHGQSLECHCIEDEETDHDWLEVGGWEIAFILSLVVACITITFWAWL